MFHVQIDQLVRHSSSSCKLWHLQFSKFKALHSYTKIKKFKLSLHLILLHMNERFWMFFKITKISLKASQNLQSWKMLKLRDYIEHSCLINWEHVIVFWNPLRPGSSSDPGWILCWHTYPWAIYFQSKLQTCRSPPWWRQTFPSLHLPWSTKCGWKSLWSANLHRNYEWGGINVPVFKYFQRVWRAFYLVNLSVCNWSFLCIFFWH